MSQVFPKQDASSPEPEETAPGEGTAQPAQPAQPIRRSARSLLGGAKGKGGTTGIIFVIVAVAIVGVFMLMNHNPKKRQAPKNAQQEAPRSTQGVNQLPTGSAAGQQFGLNADPSNGDLTADMIQQSANRGQKQQNGDVPAGGQSASPAQNNHGGSANQNSGSLGQVQQFQPPPVQGAGGGQWVPQPYTGGAAAPPQVSSATMQQVSNSRRMALTKASMTYVDQQTVKAQIAGTDTSSAQSAKTDPNRNFGYHPGNHLSTHLETVGSTAVAAPVIAVVDYDYQRNGRTIIPAGSRILGTMGASSETGIVNLRFSEIRLPNGYTESVSAIGLNHHLMPLKGYVTGRHQIQQFLLAALAGMGSTAAVFAGNNVNGQLTEADLMKMQATTSLSNSISGEASAIQQRVATTLVVTIPAGTEVEVMFTNEDKTQDAKAATKAQ